MRNPVLLTLLLAGLAGCATTAGTGTYGNFVQDSAPATDQGMAADVVKKLAVLYPPARTRFNLKHVTPDAFGAALVTALRARGYTLAEFETVVPAGANAVPLSAPSGLALAYVVDQPLDAGLYRVTVMVDRQSLSRVYEAKDGAIAPAGYWVHKE